MLNKIFQRRRFNAREVGELICDGWQVRGDRSYASKPGMFVVPTGTMFTPDRCLTIASGESYMSEDETIQRNVLQP